MQRGLAENREITKPPVACSSRKYHREKHHNAAALIDGENHLPKYHREMLVASGDRNRAEMRKSTYVPSAGHGAAASRNFKSHAINPAA